VIIGISTDTLADQQKFTDKEKLNFSLVADPEKKATKAYGALNPKNGFANRETFIIDKKGMVRRIYNKVDAGAHPAEVLKFVKDNLAEKK
jgi:peroxiredoxin Q/BCP